MKNTDPYRGLYPPFRKLARRYGLTAAKAEALSDYARTEEQFEAMCDALDFLGHQTPAAEIARRLNLKSPASWTD